MFSKFSEEAQKVLLNAKKEMTLLKHPYVGSEHLLLSILSNEELDITIKLKEYGINYDKFRDEIIRVVGKGKVTNTWFLYTPLLKRIIEDASMESKDNKEKEVTVNNLFLALLEEGDGVAIRILMGMNIDVDLLYEEFSSSLTVKKSKNKHRLLIEEFSVDLNKKCADGEIDPVVGRGKEIDNIIEILSRRCKNNPLLIGSAGVGKTAIVEELTNRIVIGTVPSSLKNKRILSVSMSSLVAGTKYRGEFEDRINKLLKEVEENDEIILFIDEIHTLVGAGGAEGAIDASNILKPSLARGKIRIIGATTQEEYTKFIEKDKALDRRFQKIVVKEPSVSDTKDILIKLRPLYESFHNTKLSDDIINYIIELSDKYIHNRNFPDKAIDILDEVCAKTVLMKDGSEKKIDTLEQKLKMLKTAKKDAIVKEDFDKATELKLEQNKIESKINKIRLKYNDSIKPKVITKDMIMEVVANKTSIPIYEQKLSNKKVLSLESDLKKKIIGQDEAIKVICDYTKRCQLGFSNNKVHSFMLIGKTGIGKTLLVKEYASLVYSKDSFIRLDMSEYKESHTISKIIGSPPGYVGYDEDNYLLEKVRNNPYSVLLLDEVEKASIDVIKLFLQILDEGKIKDSKGNIVYFNNVVIFMTSNLSASNDSIGFTKSKENYLHDKLNEYFSVEFINRIDDILVLNELKEDEIKILIKEKLRKLKKYYLDKNVKITLSTKIVDKICIESNYKKYGARKLDKIIDKKVNNYIINEILKGKDKISVLET